MCYTPLRRLTHTRSNMAIWAASSIALRGRELMRPAVRRLDQQRLLSWAPAGRDDDLYTIQTADDQAIAMYPRHDAAAVPLSRTALSLGLYLSACSGLAGLIVPGCVGLRSVPCGW